MLVYKCDICKKEIGDKEKSLYAGFGHFGLGKTFCLKCGKPIANFLEKIDKSKKKTTN